MYGICHIEIPTTDANKSKEFYRIVFDWKINESNPEYIQFSTPDDEGGGFTTTSQPTNNGIIIYIEVEDIVKKMEAITQAGGKIIMEKTAISPEFGFYALFDDPCGNRLGIWSKT